MNECITFKNHHLQLYSLNPFPQVRIFWYQIVPFGQFNIYSTIPLHSINFSQSSGCGQYPSDDSAGHEQLTGAAGTNFNKLITTERFRYFDIECTWWGIFWRHVVGTKFDTYVFI